MNTHILTTRNWESRKWNKKICLPTPEYDCPFLSPTMLQKYFDIRSVSMIWGLERLPVFAYINSNACLSTANSVIFPSKCSKNAISSTGCWVCCVLSIRVLFINNNARLAKSVSQWLRMFSLHKGSSPPQGTKYSFLNKVKYSFPHNIIFLECLYIGYCIFINDSPLMYVIQICTQSIHYCICSGISFYFLFKSFFLLENFIHISMTVSTPTYPSNSLQDAALLQSPYHLFVYLLICLFSCGPYAG